MGEGYQPVRTDDGRVLEVLTGGDPDGFPLLFHSGSPSAAVAYAPLDDAMAAAGFHLITYSRPGYGSSTPRPLPPGGPRMADDVPDSLAVLDALGVGEFVTLGWSGGGPRALACAALLRGRCRAAVTLAGAAPVDGEGLEWSAGMAEENVAEYAAAAGGAETYEAYLTEDFLPILQAGPDDLTEALGGLVTPVDRAALASGLAAHLTDVLHRAAAQGVRGARDDGLALVQPWGFDLVSIQVPVLVVQGRQDAMVPFSHGEWLAAHVPGAKAMLLEEHGHLSLVHELGPTLAELRRLSGLEAQPPGRTSPRS